MYKIERTPCMEPSNTMYCHDDPFDVFFIRNINKTLEEDEYPFAHVFERQQHHPFEKKKSKYVNISY